MVGQQEVFGLLKPTQEVSKESLWKAQPDLE